MAQTPKPDSQIQPPPAKPLSDLGAAAGLIVATSDTIRSFLLSAASDSGPRLSPELRELASDLSSQRSVSYKSLRSIWFALPIGSRPSLTRLFTGSEFVFSSPKPREKSEELKARLRKLEELAERKAYAELVKDITPKKETDEPFSSYKDQIGFAQRSQLRGVCGCRTANGLCLKCGSGDHKIYHCPEPAQRSITSTPPALPAPMDSQDPDLGDSRTPTDSQDLQYLQCQQDFLEDLYPPEYYQQLELYRQRQRQFELEKYGQT